KDAANWTCTIDETQETVLIKGAAQFGKAPVPSRANQLSQISDGLIGLSIGLPIALFCFVILHDKRAAERTKRLEQLERILQES
ncbi:MAG TPA: hypothetical protein VL134_11170, partial [Leptolyngbya sp.]|nr:hypothetical protein [Leptolyngbya sp.]